MRQPLGGIVGLSAVLLVLTSACTGSSGEGGHAGRLLVHDERGSIYTLAPDGTDRVEIAAPPVIGTNVQPTWDPQGRRVVYGSAASDGAAITVVGSGGEEVGSVPVDTAPFYFSWSPSGDILVALAPSADTGIEALLVEVGDRVEVRRLDAGRPFYFVWDPGGDAILSHVGNRRLAEHDLAEDRTVPLEVTPAQFQAPDWEGERRLYAVAGPAGGSLVLEEADGAASDLVEFEGPILFDLAGDLVAFLAPGAGEVLAARQTRVPRALPGVLTVFDLDSGTTTAVSRDPVLSFEWSPDGSKLLFLTADGQASVRWHVWTPTATLDFASFVATTLDATQYFPFFDQYARSATSWSPGSDAFTYAGTAEGGASGIWVQTVAEGAAPTLVDEEGRHATWSGRR